MWDLRKKRMIRIQTQLFTGVEALESTFGPAFPADIKAIVLFFLNLEPATLVEFGKGAAAQTCVFCADCYGILGFSAEEGRNVKRMEAGRGRRGVRKSRHPGPQRHHPCPRHP
jgi:hypothetical protein